MARHACLDVIGHLGDSQTALILEDNAGHYFLAVFLIGNAYYLHVLDRRMSVYELLDLLGVDVLAAADYHILETAGDSEVALLVVGCEVARVKPAVLVNGILGRHRHLVVALHGVVALGAELAVDTTGTFQTGLGIHDLAAHMGEGIADGVGTHLQRIGPGTHRIAGSALGLTINGHDAVHIHLVRSCGSRGG